MATDAYSDGRADVPNGISGPVDRVVVIGAGIAGLTVANALAHSGVECVVLEARDRIGGRLHTIDLAGSPVDLGASWIHHPVGNPMRTFAALAGIACRDGNPLSELAAYDCGQGRRLSATETREHLSLLYDGFPEAVLSQLRQELGPEANAADAADVFVTRSGLPAASVRRARQGLRAVIEADASDAAENESLRWIWNETDYDGDYSAICP